MVYLFQLTDNEEFANEMGYRACLVRKFTGDLKISTNTYWRIPLRIAILEMRQGKPPSTEFIYFSGVLMAIVGFRMYGVFFTTNFLYVDCDSKFRYTNLSGLPNTLKRLGYTPRQIDKIIKTAKLQKI